MIIVCSDGVYIYISIIQTNNNLFSSVIAVNKNRKYTSLYSYTQCNIVLWLLRKRNSLYLGIAEDTPHL